MVAALYSLSIIGAIACDCAVLAISGLYFSHSFTPFQSKPRVITILSEIAFDRIGIDFVVFDIVFM
jgi:hypothetical protein